MGVIAGDDAYGRGGANIFANEVSDTTLICNVLIIFISYVLLFKFLNILYCEDTINCHVYALLSF